MVQFVDTARIEIASGNGGPGCASMRREKFVEFGGPNGGDGGKGGDVLVQGDPDLTSLLDLRMNHWQRAKNGQGGMSAQKTGKAGEDKIIRVPFGTLLHDEETGEILAEVLDETPILLLKGGKGGLGNVHFKTSTNRAPRYCQPGLPGQEMAIRIELKIMADVGLVGFPNAGKSTWISTISNARPKVADYPFTTLTPKLGVVQVGYKTFVVADIPGIIEGAHLGIGLGDQFLRHIQRTKCLAFLVDASYLAEKPPIETFKILLEELEKFSPDLLDKPRVVLLTKTDALAEELNIDQLVEEFKAMGEEMLPLSSVSGDGVEKAKYRLFEFVEAGRQKELDEKKAAESKS